MLCQRYSGSGCLGIINEDIDASKFFDGLFNYVIYYGFVISACIDVCLYCQYFNGVVLLQLFLGGFQFGNISACNDEVGTFFGIGGGDSISNRTAASVT